MSLKGRMAFRLGDPARSREGYGSSYSREPSGVWHDIDIVREAGMQRWWRGDREGWNRAAWGVDGMGYRCVGKSFMSVEVHKVLFFRTEVAVAEKYRCRNIARLCQWSFLPLGFETANRGERNWRAH